jgi:ATP-dependent helicase HrpB
LLAFAYPDRIGQRRSGTGDRFLLRNGRGAVLTHPQALYGSAYIVAAALDSQGRDSRIFSAAPIEEADLTAHFANQVIAETVVEWDAEAGTVRIRRRERLGALVLRESAVHDPDPEAVARALVGGITAAGLAKLPWSKATRQLQERLIFLHRRDAAWPDLSDAALLATLPDWLAPQLYGMRSLADLQQLDIAQVLLARLAWDQRARLDELAPTHLDVPSGSRIAIDYGDPEAPALAVRLQEVFGWRETPHIAGGTVPLTLHLLSPARRPVQVTRDLASFWSGTYFEVKKDLKGRYPKHYWPDDPLQATATRRTRPRP